MQPGGGHIQSTQCKTQFLQFLCHARATVTTQAEPMLLANMGQKDHVAALTQGWRPATPSAQATVRNLHHAAQMRA